MAAASNAIKSLDYPTSDGKPMAETDWHRNLMMDLIETLKTYFARHRLVYVSGNLLLFYVPGNRRRHIAPDVFVVKGVPKHERPNYLVWQEGKGPDLVIELTSSSTRHEDFEEKFGIYQDQLRVKEYFLFDPLAEYLEPCLQGFHLHRGQYVPIRAVKGRLPSRVLGLQFERDGQQLRLYDASTSQWLPTPQEELANLRREVEHLRRHKRQ